MSIPAGMPDDNEIATIVNAIPDGTPEWAAIIIAQNTQILAAFAQVQGIAVALQSDVGPLIDRISGSPMFRMIAGGK